MFYWFYFWFCTQGRHDAYVQNTFVEQDVCQSHMYVHYTINSGVYGISWTETEK